MPVASEDVWKILYTVSRYLFPLLAIALFFLVLFYILSESRNRREKVRELPGSGTVGELIVLSGSSELDVNTWFPVPREGVLGCVRSCDLVIPCPGVHAKHLDFSWEDGSGLLIRLRSWKAVLVFALYFLVMMKQVDSEEKRLERDFGDDYLAYKARTKKLIPFLW